MRRRLLITLVLLPLAGCGWFSDPKSDPILADTPVGPDTRALVRQLPEGLRGDRENARYLSRPLVAPEIAAPSGDSG